MRFTSIQTDFSLDAFFVFIVDHQNSIDILISADNDDDSHDRCGSTRIFAPIIGTVTCERSIVGRYVELRKNGHLQLCEFIVTGYLYRRK